MSLPVSKNDAAFSFQQGNIPLLVSFPHSGTWLPESIERRLTDIGRERPDTDWELPRLYGFLDRFQPSTIAANFSRYLIDPNRSTDGVNLYPGQPTPRLCPVETFDGHPIYLAGEEPTDQEIEKRTQRYWHAYHEQVRLELERLRNLFGLAVLFDSHSIKSRVPRLFEGQLPDVNIGTANGTSCSDELEAAIVGSLQEQHECSFVTNGRFIGGYLTRHYGRPSERIHAVQLELAQCRYMDEANGTWNEALASQTRPVLQGVIQAIVNWTSQNI